jgi:hypothetical protein
LVNMGSTENRRSADKKIVAVKSGKIALVRPAVNGWGRIALCWKVDIAIIRAEWRAWTVGRSNAASLSAD